MKNFVTSVKFRVEQSRQMRVVVPDDTKLIRAEEGLMVVAMGKLPDGYPAELRLTLQEAAERGIVRLEAI